MPKPQKTLFLIADGGRARWVARDRESGAFRTVRELRSTPRPHRSYSGGSIESATGERHGGREPHAPARRQAEAFAAEVAADIGAVPGRLVLVAPPRVLSAIEAELPAPTRAQLAGTLAKDLTKVPDHELGRWLAPLEL